MRVSAFSVKNLVGIAQSQLGRVFSASAARLSSSMTVTAKSETAAAAADAAASTSSCIQIPAGVRGMRELDQAQFKSSFAFPVLAVEPREIGRLRGCLMPYTIKQFGKTLKPIMDTPDRARKLVVLNPDVVNSEEIRQAVIETVGAATGNADREITEHEFSLGFAEWDQRAIFRAVLPEGLDFSSFTQTGHLIHCNLTDELIPYGKVIGAILLEKNATCKTVVNKPDKISNTFRTFEVELLAGEPNYVVDTIEDGVKYRMDFTKVFWNSRLSHEHARVIKQLTQSSLVFDACAGIGPFVIPAAKKHLAPRVLHANDLNPESVRWLRENMRINHVRDDAITVHNEDAAAFIRGTVAESIRQHAALPAAERPEAAHIIMNLPALAVTFLPALRGMLHEAQNGGAAAAADGEEAAAAAADEQPFPVIVYCYLFAKAHEDVVPEWYAQRAREMVDEQLAWPGGVSIRKAHRVRTVSNRKEMFCAEIVVPWALMRTAEPAAESSEEPSAKRSKTCEE